MERFLRLKPEGETGRMAVWAEALKTQAGEQHRGRRPVDEPLSQDTLRQSLRTVLERGIEQANGLGPADLEPPTPSS